VEGRHGIKRGNKKSVCGFSGDYDVKLSIITVNKNNVTGLEKTVQSVVAQTFTDFEYIVIDGGSDDGSVDIIKKYADKITYWVSEPDVGIYNGMNKGIRAAHGEFCLFLNSGDWLIEGATLRDVFDEIVGLPEAGIYYSDRLCADGILNIYPENLTIKDLVGGWPISHQNTLIKKDLFFAHGFYNEEFRVTSDWEFWLREMWTHKSTFVHIKTKIAVFDLSGISRLSQDKPEYLIMFTELFGEFSELIVDYRMFYNTVYYDIVHNYGYSKFFGFALRSYRFIAKRVHGLRKIIAKKH
jgi:glycosyltransferase involved in cell wall biosynthesis